MFTDSKWTYSGTLTGGPHQSTTSKLKSLYLLCTYMSRLIFMTAINKSSPDLQPFELHLSFSLIHCATRSWGWISGDRGKLYQLWHNNHKAYRCLLLLWTTPASLNWVSACFQCAVNPFVAMAVRLWIHSQVLEEDMNLFILCTAVVNWSRLVVVQGALVHSGLSSQSHCGLILT